MCYDMVRVSWENLLDRRMNVWAAIWLDRFRRLCGLKSALLLTRSANIIWFSNRPCQSSWPERKHDINEIAPRSNLDHPADKNTRSALHTCGGTPPACGMPVDIQERHPHNTCPRRSKEEHIPTANASLSGGEGVVTRPKSFDRSPKTPAAQDADGASALACGRWAVKSGPLEFVRTRTAAP
jgi:hypothetical protein